jgi:hypothetical protein
MVNDAAPRPRRVYGKVFPATRTSPGNIIDAIEGGDVVVD